MDKVSTSPHNGALVDLCKRHNGLFVAVGRVRSAHGLKHGPIRVIFLVSAQVFVGQLYASANEPKGGSACPLLAESGPSESPNFIRLNVRYWEKRTLHCCFRNAQNNAKYLSVRTAALHPEADIELILH